MAELAGGSVPGVPAGVVVAGVVAVVVGAGPVAVAGAPAAPPSPAPRSAATSEGRSSQTSGQTSLGIPFRCSPLRAVPLALVDFLRGVASSDRAGSSTAISSRDVSVAGREQPPPTHPRQRASSGPQSGLGQCGQWMMRSGGWGFRPVVRSGAGPGWLSGFRVRSPVCCTCMPALLRVMGSRMARPTHESLVFSSASRTSLDNELSRIDKADSINPPKPQDSPGPPVFLNWPTGKVAVLFGDHSSNIY